MRGIDGMINAWVYVVPVHDNGNDCDSRLHRVRMNWPSHCNVHLPNAWKCFSFKRASISWFSQVKRKDSHSRIPPMRSASLMTSQKIPKMNENIFDIFVQPDPRSDGLIKPSSQSQSMVKPNCLNLRPPQQCNAAWYVNPLVPPRCYRTPSATHWDQWCETSECVWKQPVLGATKMKGCIDDVFHIIFCKSWGWTEWIEIQLHGLETVWYIAMSSDPDASPHDERLSDPSKHHSSNNVQFKI